MPVPPAVSGRVFSLSRESGERQDGERPCGIGAQCRRDVGMAGAAQDPDGGIAQGGHDLGRMARANLAAIFIEGDVAHPMQAVLDAPMAPPKGGQAGGVGLIRVETRERIPGFPGGPPVPRDDPFNGADLSHMRPIEVVVQERRCPQRALFLPIAVPADAAPPERTSHRVGAPG